MTLIKRCYEPLWSAGALMMNWQDSMDPRNDVLCSVTLRGVEEAKQRSRARGLAAETRRAVSKVKWQEYQKGYLRVVKQRRPTRRACQGRIPCPDESVPSTSDSRGAECRPNQEIRRQALWQHVWVKNRPTTLWSGLRANVRYGVPASRRTCRSVRCSVAELRSTNFQEFHPT